PPRAPTLPTSAESAAGRLTLAPEIRSRPTEPSTHPNRATGRKQPSSVASARDDETVAEATWAPKPSRYFPSMPVHHGPRATPVPRVGPSIAPGATRTPLVTPAPTSQTALLFACAGPRTAGRAAGRSSFGTAAASSARAEVHSSTAGSFSLALPAG